MTAILTRPAPGKHALAWVVSGSFLRKEKIHEQAGSLPVSFAANGKATDRLPFKQTSIERAAENTMKPMEFSRTDGFMVSALVLYRAGRNAPCDDKDDVCAKAALKAV